MQSSKSKLESRTPARRMAEIPRDVREELAAGRLETKNLVEWLSVDRVKLIQNVAGDLDLEWDHTAFLQELAAEKKTSALKVSKLIGRRLATILKLGDEHYSKLAAHRSDVVREWTAFVVGNKFDLTFARALAWIKPFADDSNAGVREVAWFALRPRVIDGLETAIKNLMPWTGSRSERLRRYASEITRPCGVWAAHIPRLKQEPELGLPLLEALRSDSSKYVRDSVANWLNDASKSAPAWVEQTTKRWLKESPGKETEAIVKRSLRTLRADDKGR